MPGRTWPAAHDGEKASGGVAQTREEEIESDYFYPSAAGPSARTAGPRSVTTFLTALFDGSG